MRRTLESLGVPDHVGLAYEVWGPVGDDGKVADETRTTWLSRLEGVAVSPEYRQAFARWKVSFRTSGDRVFEVVLASRLLVGHGNTSAVDVGLSVHRTWGVPVIPGSALKGLLAHHVDAVYGPDDPALPPWEQPGAERDRARYQGVTWRGRRIVQGPGEVHRKLFGAPDAGDDAARRKRGLVAGASAGLVVFHDALYVPSSADGDRPFVADVLTVHQKVYYDSAGERWPSDHDNPNPVAFLTVRPGVRMLVALSGRAAWTALAERLLKDALDTWGVGGKTSAGYGRALSGDGIAASPPRGGPGPAVAAAARLKAGDRVEAVLLDERTRKDGWKARHDPSGLVGPIQNTRDVPAAARPGDRVTLIVASVSSREIAFRVPPAPGAGPREKS
jgi:CRISPR-associated protein Cmr6